MSESEGQGAGAAAVAEEIVEAAAPEGAAVEGGAVEAAALEAAAEGAESAGGDAEAPIEGAEMLLELVLAESAARAAAEQAAALPDRIEGVLIGQLVSIEAGEARVSFAGAPAEGFAARAMAPLAAGDVGCEVALMFEAADPRRPVIMGKMHVPGAARRPEIRADQERIELSAEKEIVLRCGKASITLTRAGKILIRGAYLLTRSSGVNRIQGGSVQIN